MADQSEMDRILALYGQGFQSPALSNYQADPANELGTQVTTPDVQALLAERYSGFPGMLRGWADNVRSAVQPWSRTHATRQGPRVRGAGPEDNQLAGGLETAANWINGTPRVGPDTLAPLGLAGMGLPFAVPGAVGVFGGRLARTADQAALARAEEMAAAGRPREDIWNATGWFQGRDGHWRFEIDDSASRFNMDALPPSEGRNDLASRYAREQGHSYRDIYDPRMPDDIRNAAIEWANNNIHMRNVNAVPLPSALTHPPLFEAYPSLHDVGISRNTLGPLRGSARGNQMTVGGGLLTDNAAPHSTALHEVQHLIQDIERWAPGGSPMGPYMAGERGRLIQEYMDDYRRRLNDTSNPYTANAYLPPPEELRQMAIRWVDSPEGRHAAYRRLAGEVEARNAQFRQDVNPEQRRATPPWFTEDVPPDQQMLRGRPPP